MKYPSSGLLKLTIHKLHCLTPLYLFQFDFKAARIGISEQVFKDNAAEGRGWRSSGGGRWRWAWRCALRGMWWKLCIWRVLDLLWCLREMVSRQVCENNTCKSWAHQAIQMPFLQQQASTFLLTCFHLLGRYFHCEFWLWIQLVANHAKLESNYTAVLLISKLHIVEIPWVSIVGEFYLSS